MMNSSNKRGVDGDGDSFEKEGEDKKSKIDRTNTTFDANNNFDGNSVDESLLHAYPSMPSNITNLSVRGDSLSITASRIESVSSADSNSSLSSSAAVMSAVPSLSDRGESNTSSSDLINTKEDFLISRSKQSATEGNCQVNLLESEEFNLTRSGDAKHLRFIDKEILPTMSKGAEKMLIAADLRELKPPKKQAYESRIFEEFIDAVLKSPYPIQVLDLSHVDFDNVDKCCQFSEVVGSYSEDRLYRFVMSKESPMFKLNYIGNTSFEWDSVDNAVEVYKLPASLRWPTMTSRKQVCDNYTFPEFIIRRMNVMHRHRVNATMKRLWHRPLSGANKPSGQMVVWAGSPGCGRSIAVSEIFLECILKLQELGEADGQTKWEFHYRQNTTLTKFFFDAHSKKVSHVRSDYRDKDSIINYLGESYYKNMNSFVIYELNEKENYSSLEMPFLLSTSCFNLEYALKSIYKNDDHAFYLYDPMLEFEFKFFLDVCFAFGNTSELLSKDIYLDEFRIQGGVLRSFFSFRFQYDPVKWLTVENLNKCSPSNIIAAADYVLTVRFNTFDSYEEDRSYKLLRDFHIRTRHRFFPDECLPFEYLHRQYNWCLEIVSDNIALAIGMRVVLPTELRSVSSATLCQVQELMSIYGGILKVPTEIYKLPDRFMMENWEFYECSENNFDNANREQQQTLSTFSWNTSISHATELRYLERSRLIAIMPSTREIRYFRGMFLELPFTELSKDYVYRQARHDCPVYDALTANPALRQLFLFKATLKDHSLHTIKIPSFVKVLVKLQLDDPASIDAIYFYMITSARAPIESQHFFSFEIASFFFNACYLQVYASDVGLRALSRVISVDSNCTSPSKSGTLTIKDTKSIPSGELAVLRSIEGCFSPSSCEYYRVTLSASLYEDLHKFLNVASKIKPYICRALFMAPYMARF